jgi:hypothetical protein
MKHKNIRLGVMCEQYVWLPRKTCQTSLGLVLSYEQKQKFLKHLFFLFKGWEHWWGPGDGQ